MIKSYPLVPMQHGMLFNSLYQPDHGVDLTHITYDLPEDVQPDLVRLAWQQCVDLHDIFRTSFQWEGVATPMQYVDETAVFPFEYLDWHTSTPDEQVEQYKIFLREDRKRGFDFTTPPLMRGTLIRLGQHLYRFVWSYHHAIIDGRASSLVIHEAFSRYEHLLNGTPFPAPEPIPYQAYVDWLLSQDWTEAEAYWRKRLAGFSETTPMPRDPQGESDVEVGDQAEEQKIYLSADTTSKLRIITKQHNITFNTMIQGAWGLLLHHYNNSDDIVFGTIRACRRSAFAGTENMIGQLINSVPIRVQITPDTSVVEWLEALRQQWYSIRPHEHAPYINIKTWSDVAKGTPLFESIALYDHANVDARLKSLGGLWAHRDIDIFFKTDSPISLYAHGGERMLLSIYYERDQYRDASVTRMLQQLEQIFTAFANDPTQPIDKIGILSAEERDKILYTWNETAVSASLLPDTPYLHDLISRQAQTHPNTVAVVANGRQLTYAELEQQANQLAHYLRQQQDITAVPIGICLDRSVEMSVALLAVLKAGSAYVPIDATLPTERLNFIASDAQLPFVITDKWLPQLACQQLVCWDEENRPLFNHRPTTPPPLPHNADQPAYIIYTSGSTGQPKGVLCHHRGVINLLDDFNRRAPLAPAAHHSLWTNTTFDVSVYEIFSALTTGGTLHIVPNDLRANSSGILDWLHEYQIESAYLPPFLLPELASWLKQTAITLPIKRLLVGVEPILETTLARIQAHLPQGKILNGYGPTEATVCVTLQEFTTTTPQAKPLPIGRPMQNTEIYLLNKQLEPVPVGIAGELYIGGAGLAHGYWRRPELTARSFIDSPFIPGERLYKTGDLAHYMPDGTIEFIGRADFQVKVRGYRVELGEIEATLLQHPSIKQTVVVTRKDPVGNSYLVAYLVAEEGEGVGETAVRNFLLHKLPDYMVPSAFVTLDTLPLTPSDKIDRKALPAVALQSSGTKPQTPLEAHVAQTYASVLGLENVGRSDSFLLLGGHSLLATQVVSRLNQSLNIDLPLSAIFTRPKVSDLAEVIADLQTTSQKTAFTITPAPPNQPIPLSFAQQRLWFLQQLDPTDTSYNIPLALKLEGELNIPALEQSLNEIIRRHDALRTIFPATENEAYQVIKPHTRFHLPIIEVPHSDLAGWRSPNAKDLSCLNLIQQEAKKPFDLTQSSFRFQLLRINPIHHILLCTTHHIISDGWSHAIFTRELAALYEACSNNQPSPLAPLPVQYGDYAHAQRQWLQGKTLDKLVTYWRNKLADAPAQLDLPTDFTRPAVQTHSGGHHRHQLDAQLSQSLRHLCATNDATLFMGLLAAFKMLLHRLSQQDDIVIGTPIANRNQLETEQLIGFFINTLVLRTELESNQSFAELLTAVRTTTLDAYAHQDLPFEKLVETLQPDRDLGQTPFFQVFFNMVNVPAPETALGDITLTQLPWSDVSAKFDMTLYVTEDNDAITLELVYNRDLFSSERMAIFLNQYASLLNQISQAPNAPLASYTLATPAVTLPVPTQPLPPIWETPAHEWLTRHAQTQPHKIAVRDSHRALTYAELERQSNALAHNLLEQGIIQGDVVAIFAARSVDLLTAVCAIHKANAAFLILDPAYPASRLRDNLQIAAPKAWLNLSTDPISPLLTTHLQHIPQIPLTNQSANKPINQSTNPNDLAYIAFTSGTSGKSRAIAGTHQPLAHFWAWHTQTFALGASDQFTMLSGLAHDPLLRDLFTPIVAGGTLHIPNSDTLYAPDRLANWLQDRAITVTHLTPALGQIVAAGSTNLPPLRYAFFGGETLTENVVASLQQLAPQARCINFYGTTETPQAMGFYDTAAGFGKTAVPLGHGIDGVQLLILTHDHQLAGVGELGQIAIRTPYLAQGYLGENELTATKFIPNPFVADPPAHDCIYLTGDNGRFLPNGTIEYAGRSDSQINLRGFRIELSDIEATLTQHTAIAQAIVRPHNNQLIAYLVNETRNSTENTDTKHPRHPLSAPQHPTITQHIQQHLPTHMHPTTYITLDTLTLTPNGKIDLTALPTPDTTLIKTEFAAPTTPTEKQLAAIWTVVLNHNTPISLHDNFFALGGHSLLGTQVISRIRQQLGVELPLQTIFTAPTIAQLAREVEQATPTASDAITPQPEQPHYPLSFAQQRLWFLHQLEPDNTGYTIGTAVSLRGTLNIPALTQSLNALIQRHESLRTTFTLIDNQPRQIVNRFEPFELEIEVVDKTAVLPTLIDSHQRHPFDLAAPLARFKLLHCAPDHHILLINLHHIIADGWSATVLLNELRQAYAAHTSSSDWAPIPLPIQYRDFAHWQQHNNQLDQQLAYWANQLSGDLPVIDLPTDAPRPPQQTFVGAKQTHTLTADLTNGLQQLSQAHNATPFMTLLATFKLLLHRLTHQSEAPADIIVGSPIANRTRQETEALIGFFANTLVLRTQFDSNTPFADLLDAVRTTTLDAYAHQDLPFEQLVEALQPTRDLSRPPLFQIFFNMINVADYGNFDLPGLKTEPLSGDTIVAKFDLTLYVIDTDNTLKLEAVYNRDLFSQARIAALLEQYVGLLTQICQAPTQSLSNFSLHTETAVLPNPTLPLPARWHTPAHVRLSQLAQQQPHKIAIVQGDLRCDYAELEACSNQLAHYLLEQGIQKGDVVAVLAERTAVLPVTLLAIHKAGAAFTLLDPAYPPQRLLTSLKLAQPALLLHLSNKTPQPELAEGVLHNLLLQQAQLPSIPLHQYPNTPIHQSTSPTDLAYIAFTSGTTGQPRAIRGTHQPLAHFWQWHQATFGFTTTDQFTMLSGLAHDPLLRDIFTPLTVGGTLHIPENGRLLDPAYLANWLNDHAITITHLTPALSQIITATNTPLPTLRHAFFGGDTLTPAVAHSFHTAVPQALLTNFYGTTETPQAIAYHSITDPATTTTIPLGHGIDGAQLLVLTPDHQLAGIGESGEIAVRSPYLAAGYLDNDLTAAKFILNPFIENPTPEDRLYLTGDNGRFLPNGTVEFTGRADNQLNLRGYRIEPSEIEAALTSHPTIHQALVTLHNNTHLIAYTINTPPTNTSKTENHPRPPLSAPHSKTIIQHLQQHLPIYMLPHAIIPLNTLPLTPNGKIDHRALPDPTPYLTHNNGNVHTTPRTHTEIELANIWTTLLPVETISIHDDFFALGGHSLLATQLLSRIHTTFNTNIPLPTFFTQPTIAAIAHQIDTGQRNSHAPTITPTTQTANLPLSFAQQRLWFLDQLDATPFNIPLTLRLRGQLNIAALAASINTIVQRHSSLRTTFTTNGDNPSQQINPFMPIPLQQIDLTHLPSDAQLAEAEKLATAESLRPFNLQQDCLLRATLLHLDTENFVLLITVHHIAADGWSMGVLLDELTAVYTITIQQNPTILPPLPIQYHDYALWQRNWLQGDVLDQQLAYWQRQLADPPLGLALPTDYPRRPNMPFTAALHRFSLSPAASQRLKQFSQQERSTLFMTLLTIFKILLYRYTGQNDIIIGTPIANRTQQEIEQLIGFFVNTLVLRSQVNGNTSIRDLLTNVRQMALDAYSHQDVPFEKLVEVLQPERDLSRTPFFQIMFILQNAPQSTHDLPDLTVESFPLGERLAQYDLTTVMWEDGDCLQGVIEYKTALFEADTIAQFCRHFERLLTAVPLNPTEKIANLPLLSEAETAVLQAQQQPKTAPIKPRAVHQLFEETAVRHPHAIALDTGTQTLSYSQLNAQANQLAHYLRQKGIGHGQTVALLLYRSAATITAMLATHKSGAAYLLLDPDAPADRLHTMLDDAQPSLILTQSAINLTTTIPTVALDQLTMLDSYPNNNPNTSYQPDTPAYLIYTSGSTGKPKGVLIPHRAITNHCQAITAEYGLKSADRVLQFASLSFDVAAEEIFPTLAAGATLVLRPTDLPINFSRYVADQQLTVLNLPAAYWHDWVAHSHAQQQPIPACVRLMVVGSEKVLAERLTQWREIAPPDCRWLNAYGPTEATITATIYEPCLETIDVNEETGVGQTAVPIGHPIANTTVHILDSHHNLVLNGVAGELYIGGDGLALGYWQRPDLTAAAFVTHPQTGERLYKTGDIVRRLPCGSLAFMGRRDHQVKVRGFRIEFGEIELALRTHQELQDCLVIAQETADQPTRLIAYCIPNKNAPTPNDLRQFLQTRLPSYMVPAAFVLLDEFPLTTSGKINRRALPLPDSSPTASYIPPDGDTEQTIATIWAEVLQQPQVGRHDNFFDLGGHSLLATQIVSRIRQALTIELPIRALFESPTVAELASNLPTPDLFDDTEEALLAELLDEFEELDFDELMHDLS